MNKRYARIPALSLAVLLLASCATGNFTQSASPEQTAAMLLLQQGKPREAAQQLESQAAAASGSQRSRLLAAAAFAWQEAGESQRARSLTLQVNPRHLGGEDKARFGLINGELALSERQHAQALQALGESPQGLPPALQPRWYLARAQALQNSGDTIGAAAARARADAGLTGTARSNNQREIARLLATLDDASLSNQAAALATGDPLYNFAGRALLNRGLALPRPFERDTQWGFDTSKRAPADRDGYRPPNRVAVLLPMTGNLATAAAPVRDGLLAGYYAESRHRPQLDFVDTAGTPAGALAAYERAVRDGADYIIGPLGRDEVSALFARDALPVPVLALNRPNDDHAPPSGSAGFSLAPEDDGIIAAEYLLAREHHNVLVIAGNDDNGQRAVAAFRRRFGDRGGQVAEVITVAATPGDISTQLRKHAGVDAIFLAMRSNTARALSPQLALTGLAGKLRLGTSQLPVGSGKPEEDQALDGIVFPNEAWHSRRIDGLPSAAVTAVQLPSVRGAASRLFAFGHDAWTITAYLEKLAISGGALDGATGSLQLDGFGNILRRPDWSTFSGGQPVPLTGAQ